MQTKLQFGSTYYLESETLLQFIFWKILHFVKCTFEPLKYLNPIDLHANQVAIWVHLLSRKRNFIAVYILENIALCKMHFRTFKIPKSHRLTCKPSCNLGPLII